MDEAHRQQLQHRLRLATQEMDRTRLDMTNATESFLSAERRFNAIRETLEKLDMRSTPTEDTLSPSKADYVQYGSILDAPSEGVAGREVTGKGKGKLANNE